MWVLVASVALTAGCGRIAFDDAPRLVMLAGPATWVQGDDACRQLDPPAHLATITNAEDNAVAAELAATIPFDPSVTNTNQRQRMWLGGNSLDTVGTWVWITGEPFAYQNWRAGEPGSPTTERCLLLLGSEAGLWDDRSCTLLPMDSCLCERD